MSLAIAPYALAWLLSSGSLSCLPLLLLLPSAEHVHTISNEGFPVHNYPAEKGNLYIKYTVRFPRSLSEQQKEGIKSLLG